MYDASEMGNPMPPLANYALLPVLFWRLLISVSKQKHTPNTAQSISSEYDYIIIGGGTGGSVVASRLTEIPCVSVLLLEAGKPAPLLTEVPAFGRLFWYSKIDWKYRTAPQKYTGAGLINRQLYWPSGKTLGGSSVLNAMLYVRGNQKGYDRWEAEGAKGWGYKDVLPYFIKLEGNKDPKYVANGLHGVHGPQTIHRPRYESEIKRPLFKTVQALGYEIVDSNAGRQTGVYDFQGTLRGGQRCSTAKAYLVPAENRKNLDILPNAFVRKVLIQNRRAIGVQFDHAGTTYEIKARREVIMSAGTINTAQLLMLSGIGPRDELQRHNIPVIVDLPVGKNLQDHIGSVALFEIKGAPSIPKKILNPLNIDQYTRNRTGPLASPEFCSGLAFLKNKVMVPKVDFPDHQLYFAEGISEIGLQVGVTPKVFLQTLLPYIGRALFVCISTMLHPKSRGTVTLTSSNPYDPPIIDPNYLHDIRDALDMIEGLKTCMRIGTSPIMRQAGVVPVKTLFPGCEQYAGNEDLYLMCVVRTVVATFSHQVGTARMGDPADPRTVVDPHLRVLHIKGLRVIDASVMPIIPSANTNVPTIMVAEKASDILKTTINCHRKHEDPWNNRTVVSNWAEIPHETQSDRWRGIDDLSWAKEEETYLTPSDSGPQYSDDELKYEPGKHDSSNNEWDVPWEKNEPSTTAWGKTSPNTTPWNEKYPNNMSWNQELIQSIISNEIFAANRSFPDISGYSHTTKTGVKSHSQTSQKLPEHQTNFAPQSDSKEQINPLNKNLSKSEVKKKLRELLQQLFTPLSPNSSPVSPDILRNLKSFVIN